MQPPPARCSSQNHALCGPGCASRERTQSTSPTAPARTDSIDLSVLGV